MTDRITRATALLPAKSGARLAGEVVDGWWLDDRRYRCASARWDHVAGKLVESVMVIDALTGETDIGETLEAVPAPESRSPDGTAAVVIDGYDLAIRDCLSGAQRPLTHDGADGFAWGRPPESGISAISDRKRPRLLGLWSPDGQWFLTHRTDERNVPVRSLVEQPGDGGAPIQHQWRCAFPGDPLPVIHLAAIHVATGRIVAADPFEMVLFSPIAMQTTWFADSQNIAYLRFDRFHRAVSLRLVDLTGGTEREVLREKARGGYLELHPLLAHRPNVRVLPDSNEVIWYSERDGRGHLYLHDLTTGARKYRITKGDAAVRDIVHVDGTARSILYTAGSADPAADPGLRTLHRGSLDGWRQETIRWHHGDIAVAPAPLSLNALPTEYRGASPDGRFIVLKETDLIAGSRTVLLRLETGSARILGGSIPDSATSHTQRFTALADDGETLLHGALFLPSDFDSALRYPLLDFIYPGPQSSFLPRGWGTRAAAMAAAWAELGLIVMIVDSRGVPFRHRAIRQAGYGALLEPQLADHAAVVAQLCARHAWIDPERVGMIGSSGGGAATARAMIDYPYVYRAGIALCGNHDPSVYLAGWMEQFVGPDWRARAGHERTADHAARLGGPLLLMTGDMDENVHPAHTLDLAQALADAGHAPDVAVIPGAGHMLLVDNAAAQARIWPFLARHLLGEDMPEPALDYSAADLASLALISRSEAFG